MRSGCELKCENLHGNMNQLDEITNETHNDETHSDSSAQLNVFYTQRQLTLDSISWRSECSLIMSSRELSD